MNENIFYFKADNTLFCLDNKFVVTYIFDKEWDMSDVGILELERCNDFEFITPKEAMKITGGLTPVDLIEEMYSIIGEPEEDEPEAER